MSGDAIRVRAIAAASLAVAAPACSGAQPEMLAAPGHIELYVDTDAPVPAAANAPVDRDRPAPLFDRVRIEVFEPGDAVPCAGCTREFALDDELLARGASFSIVPSKHKTGLRVRARLYRAASVLEGTLPDEAVVEIVAALPTAPDEGAAVASLFLPTDAVGAPIGTLDAPVAADEGPPGESRVGTWAGARRRACAGTPGAREVCVPGGAFWMGNPRARAPEGYNFADALRLVVLSPFYLDAAELTVGAYRASGLVDETFVRAWSGGATGADFLDWCTFTAAPGDRDALPLNCVYYLGATSYCASVGKRLPSEAELEYVEGALASTLYPWGSDLPTCDDAVWGRAGVGKLAKLAADCAVEGSIGGAFAAPADAASAPAPPRARDVVALETGTFIDIGGNLKEWTLDRFNRQDEPCWLQNGPNVFVDPVCDTMSPTEGDTRSVRGGSWIEDAYALRAAHRDRGAPENAYPMVGIRCARSASE